MQTITVECQECGWKKSYYTNGVLIIGKEPEGRIGLISHQADLIDIISKYAERMLQDELRGLITALLQVEIRRFGPGDHYPTVPTSYLVTSRPLK